VWWVGLGFGLGVWMDEDQKSVFFYIKNLVVGSFDDCVGRMMMMMVRVYKMW
jgi:hypothetical protein